MRASIYISVFFYVLMQLLGVPVLAQQLALMPAGDCPSEEPDSVQISWVEPCENGNWLFDTALDCRMWDWHPDQHDKASWSGTCPKGQKEGRGVLQWYEHGHPIDRFEGTYRKTGAKASVAMNGTRPTVSKATTSAACRRALARRTSRARSFPVNGAMAA